MENTLVIESPDSKVIIDESFQYFTNLISQSIYQKRKIFFVCDENTHKYCYKIVNESCLTNINKHLITIKSGEYYKNIDVCKQIWQELLSNGIERSSLIINIGGGVISDVGGFVASTIKRGIEYFNFPTTLLSMVDAAIGGKTGINIENHKNQVGNFHFPTNVFINVNFLKTLPERHLYSGLVEMLKHGLILDKTHWNKLKLIIFNDKSNLKQLIKDSISLKLEVVSIDKYDTWYRNILNFGHTFGHAFEELSFANDEYKLLHGEAVACGIICESYISKIKKLITEQEFEEIQQIIIPIIKRFQEEIPKFPLEKMLEIMHLDKKNDAGQIKMIPLTRIGQANKAILIDYTDIANTIKFFKTVIS